MAFEGLSERLENSFKKLRAKGKLTEADVKEAMREVRLALLEADVNYKVAKDFTKTVTERAVGEDVMESLTPGQMVIKIVNEELTALMGGNESRLATANHPPTIIMMCGLQGSGKTTHSAKLALKLKKEGHRPLLVACDIYRPAAIKQLQVVGGQIGVPVFEMGTENPVTIAQEAVKFAKDHGHDYVFLDTAGRLHIDEQLMAELQNIRSTVHPNEILLVIDAMTGQDAVNVAKSFNETLGIDGVILRQKHAPSGKIVILRVRPPGFFLFLPQRLCKRRDQGGFEHGFAHQQVHASQLRLVFDGHPVISRHNDDRDLRPHNTSDTPGGLQTVHLRHLPVNEYHIVISALGP